MNDLAELLWEYEQTNYRPHRYGIDANRCERESYTGRALWERCQRLARLLAEKGYRKCD